MTSIPYDTWRDHRPEQRGGRTMVVAILGALIVPLLSATGLALPLPSAVYRLAVAVAQTAETVTNVVAPATAQHAAPGRIERAPGEVAVTPRMRAAVVHVAPALRVRPNGTQGPKASVHQAVVTTHAPAATPAAPRTPTSTPAATPAPTATSTSSGPAAPAAAPTSPPASQPSSPSSSSPTSPATSAPLSSASDPARAAEPVKSTAADPVGTVVTTVETVANDPVGTVSTTVQDPVGTVNETVTPVVDDTLGTVDKLLPPPLKLPKLGP